MARLAGTRPPAEPGSERQAARRERILAAAAELGAEVSYDHVQMQEVARAAGVALGTLYRYFPSKPHLFAAMFESRVAGFVADDWTWRDEDPVDMVADRLVTLIHVLLEHPVLCSAMIQATAVHHATRPDSDFQAAVDMLCKAVLRNLGREEPDDEDMIAVRLLTYAWWGVLVSTLHDKTSLSEAATEVRLVTRRLLGGSSAPSSTSR
ncbi:TetR/AcrR family transcriptional regulator [Streptomyces sp. ID03-2B]|uniref:TetR/AcrR family transcriptional regulator n=1 Tax=Streptomyces caviscabies TaxID=90079 RepID=A0ABW2MDB5_9ACTN|nr:MULTISPECIES: TetR/AcrR family transcriptional regulator [unclassified Streptomyces]MCL6289142.1 TetR family transcriptional regulator [Streptomyces sp. 43Y-GA-1]MDX3339038.1 TetR/AcrR family transcriptional regulator [Streptomyces sp. ME02-6979.5a]MDX3506405.1 TetR/AcrR family transcriptional regulator [Streptomyces sp. ATCC51928]MDX3589882.1 TetR/AcrR family transcriptional regulator [Streptomyces sp. ID03-2B]MDX5522252.1 TetR/AcrR family transcriptional regulator [Streptomyces sp. DE06-0